MVAQQIVCLANSRKNGGRCVAGKILGSNSWLRPVGASPTQELTHRELRYADGSEPKLLDLVEVGLLRHQPEAHQPENWLVDETWVWRKLGEVEPPELEKLIDSPQVLWAAAIQDDANNRLHASADIDQSLYLIRVDGVVLSKSWRYRSIDGMFRYGRTDYRLRVTDPTTEDAFFRGAIDRLGPSLLTVSLGEPWNGYCYKFIAGVIPD
jgi:hypothetical protein